MNATPPTRHKRARRRFMPLAITVLTLFALLPATANAAESGPGGVTASADPLKERVTTAERRWATSPEVRAEAAAVRDGAETRQGTPEGDISAAGIRSNVVNAAYWYRNYGTPYVWSSGWTPCNRNAADCECLNRLAYWDGGWGQLTYTLQGQANTGSRTWTPRPGDLVFWDYDGDGRFGPYDHTGVYSGNGYAIHASTYWGRVVETTVAVVSQEARGTYYINILG
ncbi:MAG: C40 family peptidase [Actinomycetota bacterium]|nr:C40 family peptidase [Actinomycetota bacterium]